MNNKGESMMQHYKDIDGKIYGYKATETCTPISIEEVIELTKPSEAELLKQSLTAQIQEAKAYLSETSWIWEKYNRNVTVLGDLTNEEFKLKYADIITKQEEARVLINTLELELQGAI